MLNICSNCGLYRPDKHIDPAGPFAMCPECGHKHSFLQLQLLMICGASAAGKSAVYRELIGTIPEVILLEADLLWRAEFNTPEEKYRGFFETWLRLAKNISQSGRPVVLFCAGGIPENIEPCVERRYFTDIHYLALTCAEGELAARLRLRPAWRESGDPDFIRDQLKFNRWFLEAGRYAVPGIEVVDTTLDSVPETSIKVGEWILAIAHSQRK